MSINVARFNEYFDIVSANTPDLLAEAYRLRYQVLCLEENVPGFERQKYPDGLEWDEYDARSVHSLLRYRPSGEFVGTVRLILSDPTDVNRPFPIEIHAARDFDPGRIDIRRLPRAQMAEISRLVVPRSRRSLTVDITNHYGSREMADRDAAERYHAGEPFFGLLCAVLLMTAQNNVTCWYACMERKLDVLLARLGLQLAPIGPVVEYHGLRQPHMSRVSDVVERIYFARPRMWRLITMNGKLWRHSIRRTEKVRLI